ncbi:MAG: ABC transporter ATP-binding protein [Verrucomicrobia bacterium]|nr:ABC transporter ATP-binding protein [Verrucomicrobiota bacterium]
MPLLELHDLSKTFAGPKGEVRAVANVTLSVEPGEFVAIRGPSGCGKTTLLLAAGGLLAPDSGEVRITGEDPYRLSPEQRAQFRAERIGFVFQQFHLVPYLDVLDNILVPSLASGRHDGRQQAEELAARFGLTDRLHHVPAQLSTGERQRAALARALLNEPKLVLADEPTGNLDGDNGQVVLRCLAEFAKNGGAVLLVTHDPMAVTVATRSLYLRNGKLEG